MSDTTQVQVCWWGDETNNNRLLAAMLELLEYNNIPYIKRELKTALERARLGKGAINPATKVGAIMIMSNGRLAYNINTLVWAAGHMPLYC